MAKSRREIDQDLAALAGHLDAWRRHIRHEAQFWPHLRALVAPILDGANDDDIAHACGRVLEMLAQEGIVDLEAGGEVVAWLRGQARNRGAT